VAGCCEHGNELLCFISAGKYLRSGGEVAFSSRTVLLGVGILYPLTPELNPSAQRCLLRFCIGDFNF
jgi:hypothetical protein